MGRARPGAGLQGGRVQARAPGFVLKELGATKASEQRGDAIDGSSHGEAVRQDTSAPGTLQIRVVLRCFLGSPQAPNDLTVRSP